MSAVSKILIIGSDHIWSIERFYLKYLKEAGIETELFGIQNEFYRFYNAGIVNKIMVRTGMTGIYKTLGISVLEKVKEYKPQLIWVFKGMELTPAVLKELKNIGYPLVNYNPDNPFIFSGSGSGNRNLKNSVGLYDLYLTYDHSVARQLQDRYQLKTGILPFGFDLHPDLYDKIAQEKEILKLCFLGNPDKARAAFLEQLAEYIPIDVYGNSWDKFVNHKNITVFQPVYEDKFWILLRAYRIQLNMMRPHNPGSHNMRTFEVPGVGGIGLFPYTTDHETYFKDGEEIFLYRNLDDCIRLAKQILDLDSTDALEIRNRARQRSIESEYSYKDRTQQLLEILNRL